MTKPASSTFKTFTSPASKSVRLQKAATMSVKARTTATGTTIYAKADAPCAAGDGTQANPYCSLQQAVNAAATGDTVDVLSDSNSPTWFGDPVTVKTSGITIAGIGSYAWLRPGGTSVEDPALVLDAVSNVTISNLIVTADHNTAVEITGSSHITVDSSSISSNTVTQAALSIDSASSDVTVSRNVIDTASYAHPDGTAISVAAGASGTVIASNLIPAARITTTSPNGLDIVGNTIQRTCASGIDIEGSSTAVNLENNLVEDTNPSTDYAIGGYKSQCTGAGNAWEPDITVDSAAATATTSDYNDFFVYGTDGTAPYSWAGTTYSDLASFRGGAAQGAHDTDEAVQPGWVQPPGLIEDAIDAALVQSSTATGSANLAAPGQLTSDYYGVSPYNSRGALQWVTNDPGLAFSLTAADASAHGVALAIDITSANVPLAESIDWGDGTSSERSFYGSGIDDVPAHVYGTLGAYRITVALSAQGELIGNSIEVATAGSDYTAYGPQRILDTRKGIGTGGTVAKVGAGSTLKLQVTGAGPQGNTIPSGITAVVLNLTVANPASGGYLTAYPNEDPSGAPMSRPTSSNVNFSPGQAVPNLAIVPIGKDGIVDLYNGSAGGTDVIADVTGYFTQSAASGYTSLTPDRLVDTRKGIGAAKAQVPANGSISVQIAGADGGLLPASGVTAVALNVTTVNSRAGGYLTVYPDGGTRPTASNLNFAAGQVIANAVIVPVGADGKIDVYNGSGGGTDVLVDVVGYYSAAGASAYLPVAPTRVLDTRTAGAGPLPPSSYAILYSQGSVTDPGLTSFVFNTTVANTKGSGYETVAPDPNTLTAYQNGTAVWPTPPTVSTLNWSQGQVVPNLVQASTGQNGIVDVWNRSGGNMDLVVDEFGYYQAD